MRFAATDRDSPALLTGQEPPPEIAAIVALPAEQRSEGEQSRLLTWFIERAIERELALLPKPQLVYCGTSQFDPDGSFRPAPSPRPVHVLHRGEITQPRDEAHPGALSCIPELPPTFARSDDDLQAPSTLDSRPSTLDSSTRRAVLADWLADDRNVLTWRSIANRVWQHHFGRGLVTTPNDFGRMGAVPTHPELLDRLAAELRDSGGSLKRLHRLIVTSSVYRLAATEGSANAPDSRLSTLGSRPDPDNLYLSRFPRRRLDAESIRDAALHLAGTLDRTMGGASVRQFVMSPGVHVTPVVDYAGFNVDDPANHRRSVYRFNFRTLPDPFMDALDCPDGSQWTPQRSESVTAIQALATLNDKLLVRQCDHLAARAAGQSSNTAAQVVFLFRLLLGRPPSADEAAAVQNYAGTHGLPNAARLLLNTNEFVFVD